MRGLLLYFGITISALHLHAQTTQLQFKVISLPAKLKTDPIQFDEQLKKCRSKTEVLELIRAQNFKPAKIIINIREKQSDVQWTINVGGYTHHESTGINLQSKYVESWTVTDISRLSVVLKDTLILIDTLSIKVETATVDISVNNLLANYPCNGALVSMQVETSGKSTILLTRRLFGDCPQEYLRIRITPKGDNYKTLASFVLTFLDEEQQQSILDLAAWLRKNRSHLTRNEGLHVISNYCNDEFGKIHYDLLDTWLAEKKAY